ncbi:MAG: septum site-determining protein MinC [Gammaproteobacteria bacterium]|nr:septum site-determining protein MinC [Gammaproteobacteria bacterium]
MTLEWPKDSESLENWLRGQREMAPSLMQEISIILRPSVEHRTEDIRQAADTLGRLGVGLIGLTGDPCHRVAAATLGLPWLSSNTSSAESESDPCQIADGSVREKALVMEGPVRSGVQIYAKDRDLVVIGQVSEGAEIMADGHVHVYGRLRGRVAAGVGGQTGAEIFCVTFEPELVSIAGTYCGPDQIPRDLWSARVRVRLDANAQILAFTSMG